EPLLLERLEVAHHPVGALDLEVHADLAHRRSVTPSLDLAADEVVDLPLPGSQGIQVGHSIPPSLGTGTESWPGSPHAVNAGGEGQVLTLWLLMYSGWLAHARTFFGKKLRNLLTFSPGCEKTADPASATPRASGASSGRSAAETGVPHATIVTSLGH